MIVASFFIIGNSVAEPFAPAIVVPESRFPELFSDMSKDTAEMFGLWPVVNEEKIPDRSEVQAPPFPGAVIVKVLNRARTGRREYAGLASAQMLTTVDFENVKAFYQQRLEGWNSKRFSNGDSIYWAKSGDVDVNSKAMDEPHVRVSRLSALVGGGKREKKLLPEANTFIEVFYMPSAGR